MNRTLLSPAQSTWLRDTFARNRATFGGWSMEGEEPGGKPDPKPDHPKDEPDPKPDHPKDEPDPKPDDKPNKGYPANTPVSEMTVEQRAAYYEHQARKHEDRNKDLLRLTGGKYGDDLKADLSELERLRTERLTDSEKAVEEAKKTAREEAQREFGPKMAKLAFETALAHREDRDDLIAALNLTSVLTDDGDVDTDKVRSIAEKIAPTAKDAGTQRHDFGAGRRGPSAPKSGVAAGADLYAASRKKTTTDS